MDQARIHAPGFPDELPWIGTNTPLRLPRLGGNVVVMHFWTSG